MALGHDAPLAVTAMGGKVAIDDNREIPDTLEVLWTYPAGTLVTFSQYNATAAPAAKDRRVGIEFRGTTGTLYLYSDGYAADVRSVVIIGTDKLCALIASTARGKSSARPLALAGRGRAA